MKSFAAVALLLLATACGTSDGPDVMTAAEAVQATCEEVLAGIDEFNLHDYPATAKHFDKAIDPAEAYAKASPEPQARALLDAVRYYATLPPEDYLNASRTSSDFARHRAVTLSQCAAGEPIDKTPPAQT